MDNTQWAQGLGFMKEAIGEDQLLVPSSITTTTTTTNTATRAAVPISQRVVERKARPPQKGLALHCPRCNSTNTKFCYYNNYSLTQPRYFCKACRRYWTQGGSIRNVPVGGGSRKNKSRSNSVPTSSSNIKNLPPQIPSSASLPTTTTTTTTTTSQGPFNQVHDLNLAYPNHNHNFLNMELSGMELLGSSGMTTGGLGPLMPMHMPMPMPSPEESSGGTGMLQHAAGLFDQFDGINMQEGGRRMLFPFGDLKQEQHRGHGGEQPMFWNGMMGASGAGSW